jgi:hypothetical protein
MSYEEDREWESYSQDPGLEPSRIPRHIPNHISPNISSSPPIPLFGPRGKATPFPVAALGPLAAAVQEIIDNTSAPAALAAQSVLAAVSFATQALADVETLHAPKPVSLFFLTVADTGERKSACDHMALQGVRAFELAREATYRAVYQDYQNRLEIYEHRRRSILSQPSLGLFSDEGGQFFSGFGMSSDNKVKTASALSKLWDGSAINRTRAGAGPSRTYWGKRLTCHLMIQIRIAERVLSDQEMRSQGLLSRVLVAWPESTIGTRLIMPDDPPKEAVALPAFHRRIEELLERGLPESGAQAERKTLALCPIARTALIAFYNKIESEQAECAALSCIRGFASKAVEQTARLAGILQIFQDETTAQVSAQTMQMAITLMCWYVEEAKRLFETSAVPEPLLNAEKLRCWLLDHWIGKRIDVRSIVRFGPPELRETEKARTMVRILAENGWLIRATDAAIIKGNRSLTNWHVIRA